MPSVFTDSANRTWTIDITVGSNRRVLKTLGLNLINAAAASKEGETPLMTRLMLEPDLLVDVVYVLVQPQAEQRNVDDVGFGESIDGAALSRMHEAFWEALTDFFQASGRTEMVKAIRRQTQILNDATQRVGHRIDDYDVDVDAVLDESIRGNSATNSPASSAPTPTPGPSASSPG
ncbi:MAG: hypothetical protein GVY28_12495 [Alphaproteobacteria bacterium]|jgi:hypothetical protein|nr:hypothetical protein [Alphaproteobacteria bacterium]